MHDTLGASVYFSESLTLGRGERARRLEVVDQSPGYFAVLVFNQPSDRPGCGERVTGRRRRHQPCAVAARIRRLPDVLGQPIQLGLDTDTIVAVAPRCFARWLQAFRMAAGAARGRIDPVVALRTE